MAGPLLYSCPPLEARITAKQCKRNAAIGARGRTFPVGSNARLRSVPYDEKCDGCPGVEALAKQNGFPVEEYCAQPQEEPPKKRIRRKVAPMTKNTKTQAKHAQEDGTESRSTLHRMALVIAKAEKVIEDAQGDIDALQRTAEVFGFSEKQVQDAVVIARKSL